MKKNNKGFSLVELIVVVLIMGILAVALAPQVMKWVGKAQESGNRNNAESVKSALQTAAADFIGQGGTFKANISITADEWNAGKASIKTKTDAGTNNPASGDSFADLIDEVTGGDYKAKIGDITIKYTNAYSVSIEVKEAN